MTNYVFRHSARVSGVSAQVAGEELARIQAEAGQLTAALVVDKARPVTSPLHAAFEWNDHVAAEYHREHQARNLIRSVEILQPDKSSAPAYIHVQTEKSYMPTLEVVKRFDLYEQAYRAACARVAEAEHSLQKLQQLADQSQGISVNAAILAIGDARNQLRQATAS